MATLADDPPVVPGVRDRRPPKGCTAVLLLLVMLILGYLGWVLPSPGGSLVVPTLVVLGTGLAVATTWWVVEGRWGVVTVVMAITVVASLWTFTFALPAYVAWGSDATQQAQTALARLDASPKRVDGAPSQPCLTVHSGSLGPIGAPYRMCAVSTPEGHFVTFLASGQDVRGLGYTDTGAATFPDECSRHLTGKWWMFTGQTDGMGGCPFGYQFHGGG